MTTPIKWGSEIPVNTTTVSTQDQEGRDPSYQFDTQKYLAGNPDVDAAHIDPLEHFLLFGAVEGRAAIAGGWL